LSITITGQTISGRFQVIENSDSSYSGKIQVKLEEGSSAIGNAVIRYKFNPNRMSIPENPKEGIDFNIYNFQNGNYISSVSHPSEDVVSINIAKLFGEDISINSEYIDVADISFDVKDSNASSELQADIIQFFAPSSSEMWKTSNWVVSYGGASFQFPELIFPNDGEENIQSSVTLRWRSIDEADNYHLQLSNDETFANLIYDNSELTDTSRTFTLENSTQYFWRVSYSNNLGTSLFSSKYSFTTIVEDTPQVILSSPTNDSTITGTTVMLKWQSVSDRDFYQLQVANDTSFNEIAKFIDTLHINEIEITDLEKGEDYYWRVRASIENIFGQYSNTFRFSTTIGDTTKPILLAPLDNEEALNTTITFNWESIDTSDYYQLEIAEDQNFAEIFYINENVVSNEQTVYNFEKGRQYYWRVRFSNSSGNSMYSNVFTFETLVGNPTIPTLLAPLNNSVDLSSNLTFNWENEGVSEHYKIEIYTDSGIQNMFYSEDSIGATEVTINNFEQGEQYYWRVRSTNRNGNSAFSDIYKFRTRIGEPSVLTLLEPMNNSVGLDNSVKFNWTPIDSALYYQLEISEDADFNNVISNKDSIFSTDITIHKLEEGLQYYWRIKSHNQFGSTIVSNIFNFSTHIALPDLPVAHSPAKNAKNIGNDVSFDWSSIESAEFYQLEVAKDYKFKDIEYSEDTLTINKITLKNLKEGNQYYWRVKAINNYGNSNFTDKSRFSVRLKKPSKLTSKVVENEFIDLSWVDNSNMEERCIIERKTKDEKTSNPFVVIDTISANQKYYNDYSVEDDQNYIYRVYMENSVASSEYSNTTELLFSVEDPFDSNIPVEFALSQNYPNPFNPNTKINYSLKEMSDVGIKIYNILGEVVATLVSEVQDAGTYNLEWDASHYTSGVYIYVLNAESQESNEQFQAVNKMILLK